MPEEEVIIPRIVTGYIEPIKLDAIVAIMNAQIAIDEGRSCCGGDCCSEPEPLTNEQMQEAAYYIWLETGADAEWCWFEALRRNSQ